MAGKSQQTNDDVDLELPDSISDGDELAATPDQSWLLNATNRLLKSLHIGLIIPRLHVESDDGLFPDSQSNSPRTLKESTLAIVLGLPAFLTL